MSLKTPLNDALKGSLANGNPFPVKAVGKLRLVSSDIPKETAVRVPLWMDEGSMLMVSSKALALKITADELLRRLVWCLGSEG